MKKIQGFKVSKLRNYKVSNVQNQTFESQFSKIIGTHVFGNLQAGCDLPRFALGLFFELVGPERDQVSPRHPCLTVTSPVLTWFLFPLTLLINTNRFLFVSCVSFAVLSRQLLMNLDRIECSVLGWIWGTMFDDSLKNRVYRAL